MFNIFKLFRTRKNMAPSKGLPIEKYDFKPNTITTVKPRFGCPVNKVIGKCSSGVEPPFEPFYVRRIKIDEIKNR